MKFHNRNLHKNIVVIFKQLKTVQNVYFSYLEAGDIVYLSFQISKDSELEKWPNYPDLPYKKCFPPTESISVHTHIIKFVPETRLITKFVSSKYMFRKVL